MNSKRPVEYDFEKLNVYREAFSSTEDVYRVTRTFPSEEQYGIVSQLRRAAMSIALNIAEGKGRYHDKVFVQFLYQARGSLFETMTLLKLSRSLSLIEDSVMSELLNRTDKISAYLNNLIKALASKP